MGGNLFNAVVGDVRDVMARSAAAATSTLFHADSVARDDPHPGQRA